MKPTTAALLAGCLMVGGVQSTWAEDDSKTKAEKVLKLFKKVTGKELAFTDFQTDDGAAHVSAASMVGIAADTVTVAESTRDFAAFVKGFDNDSKGIGFAISPARVRHPWPKVQATDYLERSPIAILLTGLTLSLAQGHNEIEKRNYQRRAVAITTGGTFKREDDAIWVLANAMAGKCVGAAIEKQLQAMEPKAGGNPEDDATAPGGEIIKKGAKGDVSELSTCLKSEVDKLNERWYRSLWSVTFATGDVKLDVDGGKSVRLGETLVVAARYGDTIGADASAGWSVSASAKFNRNEPVLATLGTATLERRNTSMVAVKGAFGTATWRGVTEYSNARTREALAGEMTLKKAIGLDYRLYEGWWLNLRYGKRKAANDNGEEVAGLMSLTISPSALFGK